MSAIRKRDRSALGSRAVQVAFVLALVGLWYIGTTYGRISPILLPNPVNVYDELIDVLATLEFVSDLLITLKELAIAFAISSVSGITLGYLISRSQYSIRVFEPLMAGRSSWEPGLKVGKNPLSPTSGKIVCDAAPNARPNPIAQ